MKEWQESFTYEISTFLRGVQGVCAFFLYLCGGESGGIGSFR